jgi:hypothetical protein
MLPHATRVESQSSCFSPVHPGLLVKALKMMWYLKWLVQMSRILALGDKRMRERGMQEVHRKQDVFRVLVVGLNQNMKEFDRKQLV